MAEDTSFDQLRYLSAGSEMIKVRVLRSQPRMILDSSRRPSAASFRRLRRSSRGSGSGWAVSMGRPSKWNKNGIMAVPLAMEEVSVPRKAPRRSSKNTSR